MTRPEALTGGSTRPERPADRSLRFPRRRLTGGPWLGVAVLAAGVACHAGSAGGTGERPNLILISVDTLRADHLGCYGYGRPTSPAIDALASESLRFTQASTPAAWTLPAHAGMLTGVHPYDMGFRDEWSTLPPGIPTLAGRLHDAGYETAAFVDSSRSGFVGAGRGFDRGFETYQHVPELAGGRLGRFDTAKTLAAVSQWLFERRRGRPFFLFLHTKGVHSSSWCSDPRCVPYATPRPFSVPFLDDSASRFPWRDGRYMAQFYLMEVNRRILTGQIGAAGISAKDRDFLVDRYDANVAYVDHYIGLLIAQLRGLGLLDTSVVVLTADHGEEFQDHGLFIHQQVYDELLHVPLILRLPKAERRGVSPQPSSLLDVAPTFLSLAGVADPALPGRNLLAGASGGPRDLMAYYEYSIVPYQAYALAHGRWRLVAHTRIPPPGMVWELYDARQDPRERRAVVDNGAMGRLKALLLRRLRHTPRARAGRLPGASIEAPDNELLRSLGYIE